MKINKIFYPDGSFYHQIENIEENKVYNINHNINNYSDLWALYQIKDIFEHYNCEVNLQINCLIDAQSDKRFEKNQSANLKLICKFLNKLNFKTIKIFHPHNSDVIEAILDNYIYLDNSEYIKLVLEDLFKSGVKKENLILMSIDAGGYKPLMKLADKLNWQGEVYSASKSRNYIDGKVVLNQQVSQEDFNKKDILLIDDLIIYGGSMIGLSNILKERNIGNLYCAVSHITVNSPNEKFETNFKTLYTTNSKNIEYYKKDSTKFNNLKVIKMFT